MVAQKSAERVYPVTTCRQAESGVFEKRTTYLLFVRVQVMGGEQNHSVSITDVAAVIHTSDRSG